MKWITTQEWADKWGISKTGANALARRGAIVSRMVRKSRGAVGAPCRRMIPDDEEPPPGFLHRSRIAKERQEATAPPDEGDEYGRDEWCRDLRKALHKLETAKRPRVANWRKVLTSIEDCMGPARAAIEMGLTIGEWRGLREGIDDEHRPRVMELGRMLLDRRGLEPIHDTRDARFWAEHRREA